MSRYWVIAIGTALFSVSALGEDRGAESRYIERARSGLAFPEGRERIAPRRMTRHLTQHIATFEATVDGLPVFLERTSVQVAEALSVRRRAGNIAPVPRDIPAHPRPDIDLTTEWMAAHGEAPEHVAAGWLRDRDGRLLPVVRVDTRERLPAEPLRWYLDATSGRIVQTERLRWTQEAPLPMGSVFIENPLTTPDVTTIPLEYLDDGTSVLNGRYAQVSTCTDLEKCKDHAPIALRSDVSGEEFVFDPILDSGNYDDPFAEVNVYYHISTFSHWMRETFGWDALFHDNEWIEVRVGREWDNAAFYAGNDERTEKIIFGKSEEINYAYDADVAFHEFSHAIIQSIWEHSWMSRDDYGIDVSMNGIEEGMADMWAQTFAGDPDMNVYITRSRTAANDNTCPGDLYSEGHLEAMILSAFAWDVREEIGKVPFEQILYRSMFFLEEDIDFKDFVAVLEQSAKDLAAEDTSEVKLWHAETIRQKAIARGLLDEDCLNRVVPLIDKQTRLVVGYGSRRTNKYDYPFGLQWKIEAPEGAESFKLLLEWIYPEEDDDGEPVEPGYRVHIRRGEPVEVKWLDDEDLIEGEPAFEPICDYTFDGAPTEVGFPLLSMAPAESGEVFYVLLSADHDESILAVTGELRFSMVQSTPPDDSPAPAEADEETDINATGRSSGCRVAAPASRGTNYPLASLIRLIF